MPIGCVCVAIQAQCRYFLTGGCGITLTRLSYDLVTDGLALERYNGRSVASLTAEGRLSYARAAG